MSVAVVTVSCHSNRALTKSNTFKKPKLFWLLGSESRFVYMDAVGLFVLRCHSG